ncbi:15471_t:CDS:2 [Funneliformis geosporum]|uniref:15471_t:CDS:1 n=1 Tax=Funneliformis geosporum TaxID=1117311 RepID=A0A9W4SUT5_9GLOM|nr:15471_t:CDS:2 [Funneliformis geosporum]
MDGVLVRQPSGTIGAIEASEMNRYTVGTRETARASPFHIILTTRGFLVRELRVAAAGRSFQIFEDKSHPNMHMQARGKESVFLELIPDNLEYAEQLVSCLKNVKNIPKIVDNIKEMLMSRKFIQLDFDGQNSNIENFLEWVDSYCEQ